ncbi:DUF3592 domain-containing protein [Actinoplanes sp. LDG1-06]|uniref:DUF3592 domain-containing protein n=1 Tax=Paractinoplanes ovalisporus TaxID=2810368 RepID=A0ABS2AFC9_9ACTN|nr:DUF3592 domain-containing protein [Actinoplanes ovalisporus]
MFGLAAIVLGIRRWQRVQRLHRDGHRITAVVDGNQREARSERSDVFLPVVRFHTREGRDVRTALDSSPSHREHLTDVPIEIVYDPADPQRAVPADSRGGGLFGAVAVGLFFLASSAGIWFLVTTTGFLD